MTLSLQQCAYYETCLQAAEDVGLSGMSDVTAPSASLLDVRGLSYWAGGKLILQSVDVRLARGQLVGIIGASGAGKSTLVKLCAGVIRPAGGQVLVEGRLVQENRKAVAYVPQEDIVHHALTVEEALSYGGQIRLPRETTREELEGAIDRVLNELELTEQREQLVASLSGGQLKRVNVAMELLTRPSLIFLDEPTTGLDPALERRTMENLRTLAHGGRGVMVVTHATSSLELCDAIIVMAKGGRLVYWGALDGALKRFGVDRPEEIYEVLEADEIPADVTRGRAAPEPTLGGETAERSSAPKLTRDGAGGGFCGECGGSIDSGTSFCGHCGQPIIEVITDPELGEVAVVRRSSVVRQLGAVLGRGLRLLLRDRRNLLIMFGQVPLIALLIIGLFKPDVLEKTGGRPGDSLQLLFMLVTAAIWFGSIGAAREIVKESAIYMREAAAGLRSSVYLVGKYLIQALVVALQTSILFALVVVFRPTEATIAVIGLCLAILVLTGMVAVAMGLVISASVRTEEQAASILPLVLIPQLLFAGAIVPVAAMSEPVARLSALAFSQWSFSGLGIALDMSGRISADTAFASASRFGTAFFGHSVGLSLAILSLFALVFLLSTWLVLRARSE